MDSEVRSYRTGAREVVLDITADAEEYVAGLAEGRREGLLHLFVPHATAGIAILETGAGSDEDLLAFRTSGGEDLETPELLGADVAKYRIASVEAP